MLVPVDDHAFQTPEIIFIQRGAIGSSGCSCASDHLSCRSEARGVPCATAGSVKGGAGGLYVKHFLGNLELSVKVYPISIEQIRSSMELYGAYRKDPWSLDLCDDQVAWRWTLPPFR